MNDIITIVYCYIPGITNDESLILSLRSLRLLDFDFEVVIAGSKPEWLSDECKVIDAPCEDKVDLLKLVIDSGLVSECFIWMPDNVHIISPVSIHDIAMLKKNGYLEPDCKVRDNTIKALKDRNLATYNFCTNTPYFLSKDSFVRVFEEFNDRKEYDFISLFYNFCAPLYTALNLDFRRDNICLPIISKDVNPESLKKYSADKKFIHNSSLAPTVTDFLLKRFPTVSIYEKED